MADINRSIKIYIDGSQAQQGIAPVEQAIKDLQARIDALDKTDKNYQKNLTALNKELEAKQRTLANYKKKVEDTDRVLKNLSGATYKELLAVQKQLRKEMQEAVPGTHQYNAALEQNRRVTERLAQVQREMRVEVGAQGNAFSRAANFVNRFGGIIASAAAAVTGLTLTFRKSVQDYAQMEEAMANVRKYTGMTTDEVKNLNEALKKMDTRTSREKLNTLAGDAGRLGITSKEAILEFVDAADKINVALGEDLGEDAVKNIGKLAQMFGEDKTLGLRGAMLATGSAINEVAQSCSAAEPYLVDFTARVAGVANQAGLSQADIIGFAASMDENMLQSEKSSTAFQKVLMKMFTDSAKFANAAGLDVQKFSELVKNDAMEAMLQFAEALSKKGGLYDLAPIFGDLKTEGAGVASMLSVMAGKAEEIRQRQELANKAYREGTSILKEYDVQNTTVQAGLDKAKKGFLEVSIQLSEKLQPAMSHVISGTSALVRILNTLITFLTNNIGTLTTVTAAWVAYTAALKAHSIQQAIVNGWNVKIVGSLKTLFATLKANPYALIASAVATIVSLYIRWAKESQKVINTEELLSDVSSKAAENADKQRQKLEDLQKVLNDTTRGYDERKRALEELKELVPDYNADLNTEGKLINANADALARYNQLIGVQSELKEVTEQLNQHRIALMEAEKAQKELETMTPGLGSLSTARKADQYQNEAKAVEALTQRYKDLVAQQWRIQNGKGTTTTTTATEPTITEPTTNNTPKTAKEILQEEKQRIADMKALRDQELTKIEAAYNAQNELQQTMLETGKMSQQEYQIWQVGYAHAAAQKKLEVEQKYQDEFLKLRLTNQDLVEKAQQESDKRVISQQARTNNARLKAETTYQKNLDTLKKMGEKADTSPEAQLEAEYQTKLALLEAYYKAALQYAKEHGQDEAEVTRIYNETKAKLDKEYEDNKRKLAKKTLKEIKALQGNDISQSITSIINNVKKLQQAIDDADFGGMVESIQGICNTVLSGLSNAFNTFKQIEIDNIEAKYDAEIQAAGDNTEKIEQLEEEKAQAKLDIEKKYADVDFAVKCSQIIANTALAIMMAYAQLGPVAGSIAAALMVATGAIQLAAAVAERNKVKNMTLSGSGSSGSGSGSREATGRTTTQYAAGRYDVIGADDGRHYNGVPYIGDPQTGIVRRPALISESGAELIVNADDLKRLQHHVNYPLVVDAINDSRRPAATTQHAAGNYKPIDRPTATVTHAVTRDPTLDRLAAVLERIDQNGIQSAVTLTELDRAQRLRAKARKIGSKC